MCSGIQNSINLDLTFHFRRSSMGAFLGVLIKVTSSLLNSCPSSRLRQKGIDNAKALGVLIESDIEIANALSKTKNKKQIRRKDVAGLKGDRRLCRNGDE